jgi:hypothetical protein
MKLRDRDPKAFRLDQSALSLPWKFRRQIFGNTENSVARPDHRGSNTYWV